MALIKITDKHLNLGLKFEQPIALNPEKKYKLCVRQVMLSFDKKIKINMFYEFLYQYQILATFLLLNVTLQEIILLILYKKNFKKNVMMNSTC